MFNVIIPSRNPDNLRACVASIRENEPGLPPERIIVIDDGARAGIDGAFPAVHWVPGIKPFVFARAINQGIQAAGGSDVILLNDDALLKMPEGFIFLHKVAQDHPEYGLISATTNITGNPAQRPHGIGLRDEIGTVPFICVLLPRKTIETVGLMDERFGGRMADGRIIYGFCDTDMCRRIRAAGLKVGIHDGCFVDHRSLRSTFRGDPTAAGDISAGRELYLEKWGNLG